MSEENTKVITDLKKIKKDLKNIKYSLYAILLMILLMQTGNLISTLSAKSNPYKFDVKTNQFVR